MAVENTNSCKSAVVNTSSWNDEEYKKGKQKAVNMETNVDTKLRIPTT